MTLLQQIEMDSMQLAPGAHLVLDPPDQGWSVQTGRLELFLVAVEEDRTVSPRHFLFEVKAGGTVMPPLARFDDLRLVAIATESCTMRPLGAVLDVPALDGWIAGLSSAVAAAAGPAPDGAQALMPSDTVEAEAGAVLTMRAGVAWMAGGTTLTYCGAPDVAARGDRAIMPVAPGTWVVAGDAGQYEARPTEDVLAAAGWQDALREFHRLAFSAVGRAIGAAQEKAGRRVAARAQNSERLTERVIGSFQSVARSSRRAWQSGAKEDERLLAVFMIVAEAIGLDLTQRTQEQIAKAKSVDEAIRTARLRQRPVALRGDWWRQDLGPLVAFVGEDRKAVALLPTGV